MPTSKEVQAAMSKPQILRLKQLGKGMKVGHVLGARVLIKTVIPWTQMDEVEKEGILVVPKSVRDDNTPLPSTGFVIEIGRDVEDEMARILEGAAVMFSKFAGADFVIDEEDFKILDVAEIMCTIEFAESSPIAPIKLS